MSNLHEEFRSKVREGSLAARLSDEELSTLLSLGVKKSYARGAVLFHQGDLGDLAGFILKGAVKISVVAGEGKDIAFAYLGAGDTVGEISLLDGKPRTASGVVVEAAELIIVDRRTLQSFLRGYPDAALKTIEYMCDRLRQTNALLEADRAYSTEVRLARAITRLIEEHGRIDQDGSRLRFRVSQAELGAFASLSRENVNRQLKEWSDIDIISIESGQVIVRDRDALEEIAVLED